VPDFEAIIQIYQSHGKDINDIQLPLMGGQEYDFNYHKSVFNRAYLNDLLKKCGFSCVIDWNVKSALYYGFDDWAGRAFVVCGKEYRISLNLEAVK
jgi:hypothetical protein